MSKEAQLIRKLPVWCVDSRICTLPMTPQCILQVTEALVLPGALRPSSLPCPALLPLLFSLKQHSSGFQINTAILCLIPLTNNRKLGISRNQFPISFSGFIFFKGCLESKPNAVSTNAENSQIVTDAMYWHQFLLGKKKLLLKRIFKWKD